LLGTIVYLLHSPLGIAFFLFRKKGFVQVVKTSPPEDIAVHLIQHILIISSLFKESSTYPSSPYVLKLWQAILQPPFVDAHSHSRH